VDTEFARRISLLMLPEDEEDLVAAVRARFPEMVLIPSYFWPTHQPPVTTRLADCEQMAFLWDPTICPTLPTHVRANGAIAGPMVGPVIQWLRCKRGRFNELQVGSLGASADRIRDPQMTRRIAAVWRIVKKHTSNNLRLAGPIEEPPTPDQAIRDTWIGAHALAAARAGDLALADIRVRLLPT